LENFNVVSKKKILGVLYNIAYVINKYDEEQRPQDNLAEHQRAKQKATKEF
jgi:hypothetical protein